MLEDLAHRGLIWVKVVFLILLFGTGLFLYGAIDKLLAGHASKAPCQDTMRLVALSPVDATPLCDASHRARVIEPQQPPWQFVWVECTCR